MSKISKKFRQLIAKIKFFIKILQSNSNSVCIDCGANIGKYSIMMARRGAKVYAFEPNPWAFEKLLENTKLYPNIISLNKAISTSESRLKLFLHEKHDKEPYKNSTGSSLEESKINIDKLNFVEIEAISLSNFIDKNIKKVSILKIDIEGHETKVIPDLINKKIYKKIESCFVETHSDKNQKLFSSTKKMILKAKNKPSFKCDFNWH